MAPPTDAPLSGRISYPLHILSTSCKHEKSSDFSLNQPLQPNQRVSGVVVKYLTPILSLIEQPGTPVAHSDGSHPEKEPTAPLLVLQPMHHDDQSSR
jgi:hypothetical protein